MPVGRRAHERARQPYFGDLLPAVPAPQFSRELLERGHVVATLPDVAIAQYRRALAALADRDELLALALVIRDVPFAPNRHTGNSYSTALKMVDILIFGARVRDALSLVVRERR